jgi:putative ABC transport system permease protein
MCQVVQEQWDSVRDEADPLEAARFWARQGWAVARAAVRLRWDGARGHGSLGTPRNPRSRDDDGRGYMDGLGLDLRHAARGLRTRPLFTLITAGTLALGIGSSTALFSAVHAVLLRDLPYAAPDRIVALVHEDRETGERGDGLSAANARDLSERVSSFSAVAVAEPWSWDLAVDGRAEALRGWLVSPGFFRAVGVEPRHGRSFLPGEYREGEDGSPVVLLGHGAWTRRFGADPALVGRSIRLEGRAVTVVGILPPEFALPGEAELIGPRPWQPYDAPSRAADYMSGFARLAPGATVTQARAEVDRLARSLAEAHPETNATTTFRLVPLREHLFGDVRTPLLVLLGAVGFVLLIACANVAGLLLARGAERQREYALRGALGASAGRLVRQVVSESALLAALGCLLGLAVAWGGVQAIRAVGTDHLPRLDTLAVDGSVLAFAVTAAALSALLGGLAPSLRLARPDLAGMMREGGRGAAGSRASLALRNRLVMAEVAAAVVLLVGAGLLLKSFTVLLDQELGFDPEDRVALQVFAYGYGEDGRMTLGEFVDGVVVRLEALPGVEGVALTSSIPGATDGTLAAIDVDLPFVVADRAAPPRGQEPRAWSNQVSAGFFEVMEIPVRTGRALLRSDDGSAPPVLLVNETLARRHFPDTDPVGERILLGSGERQRSWEIVGVVADVRSRGHARPPRPEIYRSLYQSGTGSLTFVVHAPGNAAGLLATAREAVWEVNPSQSIWGTATVERLLGDWLGERRFNLLLLGGFAVVALLLAAVGIYGLVSYSVEQRVAELGVRKALGGRATDIVTMVLREGLGLAAAGVALGILGALVLTRFLEGMLFGVEPTDPAIFVLLSATVLAVAALAALVPALRAARLDAVSALRRE